MLLLLCSVLVFICIYWKLSKLYNFWTVAGVKQRRQIYLAGDYAGILFGKESFPEAIKTLYNQFPRERYVGFYQLLQPTLLLRDPELIKRLTIKDFDYFADHRQFTPDGVEPLWSNNIFSLKGNKWRHMRTTLSPSFTSSKMKMLHNLVCESSLNFTRHFSEIGGKMITLNFKDVSTRFTSDMIASIVFCVKCDSLKDRKNEFYLKGLELTGIFKGFWKILKFFIMTTAPEFAKFLRLSLFSTEVKQFFSRVVKENIKIREENKVVRQDMLHLLLEAKKGSLEMEENEKLSDENSATAAFSYQNFKSVITDENIIAQAMVFFFGGFDTMSILICFMAHELSLNANIQDKLRDEIDEVIKKYGDNLPYDVLVSLKYMDMVVTESLRKWPPVFTLERTCVKPYTIEPENPSEKPVQIQIGDVITIPVYGLQHDPQYYERPEEFDPERFNDENRNKINPLAYLPFGTGPRNCIGARFALLVAKVFFFHLLSKFELITVKKTQVPLKLKRFAFSMEVEKGHWIGLKHRSL